MAISRGSVRHTVAENIVDLVQAVVQPSGLNAAGGADRAALAHEVRRIFPDSRVAAFPFARTCLHAVLAGLELPSNSRVLMTPITIGPMVEVIESFGHEVVFVDIETETFGPCLQDLRRKLESGANCFLLTHLFGYVSSVRDVVAMCRAAGVRVIEDISHNIGSTYEGIPLGMWGDVAIYSASLLKYVDGYNGAFTVTKDERLGAVLEHESVQLERPDRQRVRSVILKTLVWNVALSRWTFSLATWPVLRLLRIANRPFFERLLGPGIPFRSSRELPQFYFEHITKLQCSTIVRNLRRLSRRLEARQRIARRATNALETACAGAAIPKGIDAGAQRSNTFWQFVVKVRSTEVARSVLFSEGVETSTTNLRDLAHADGIDLPGARALKEQCIFIPLHEHLREGDYLRLFNALRSAGQLSLG